MRVDLGGGRGTKKKKPLRLQRGDDEKHTHRNGGRLGKDEPEIAHGLSGRRFGGDLGCLSAAVRPRGMRGFFFQAEDGIRYGRVTGVQTCALRSAALKAQFRARSPERVYL